MIVVPNTEIFASRKIMSHQKLVAKSILIQTKQTFGSINFKCKSGSKVMFRKFHLGFSFYQAEIAILDSITFCMLSDLAMWCDSITFRYLFCNICILLRRFWARVIGIFCPQSCQVFGCIGHLLYCAI